MRTKLTFWLSMLCFLATAILLTIYLTWLFYPLEISWLHLENQVYLKSATIQHNFNILMNYLTNPFQQKLSMPDFRSSNLTSGLFVCKKHYKKKISICLFKGDFSYYLVAYCNCWCGAGDWL